MVLDFFDTLPFFSSGLDVQDEGKLPGDLQRGHQRLVGERERPQVRDQEDRHQDQRGLRHKPEGGLFLHFRIF